MNKTFYKTIQKIRLAVEARADPTDVRIAIDEVIADLEDKYDNMSETRQDSDAGEEIQDCISTLGDASAAVPEKEWTDDDADEVCTALTEVGGY